MGLSQELQAVPTISSSVSTPQPFPSWRVQVGIPLSHHGSGCGPSSAGGVSFSLSFSHRNSLMESQDPLLGVQEPLLGPSVWVLHSLLCSLGPVADPL